MALTISIPFQDGSSVKDLIFTILISGDSLKLISLTSLIKKKFGRSVTFQGVRKATLELVSEGVLLKEDKKFKLSLDWIKHNRDFFDSLYTSFSPISYFSDFKKSPSFNHERKVFKFSSLGKMMKFWQNFIGDWYKTIGDSSLLNCYQACHAWEALLYLDKEMEIMEPLKIKGVKSYILTLGNTLLDQNIAKFYSKLGIEVKHSKVAFSSSDYLGTYGDIIIQTKYPEDLVEKLDSFFSRHVSLESFDLTELHEIVNQENSIELVIFKDKFLADQINRSILSNF